MPTQDAARWECFTRHMLNDNVEVFFEHLPEDDEQALTKELLNAAVDAIINQETQGERTSS